MNNLRQLIKQPMKMDAMDDLEAMWSKTDGDITRFFTLLFKIVGTLTTPVLIVIMIVFLIQFGTAKRNGDDTDDIVKRLIIIGVILVVVGGITGMTWLWA